MTHGSSQSKAIPLTQGKIAIVDAADYEWLMQWKWQTHRKGRAWYANRGQSIGGGKQRTVWMHRAVLDAPDGVQVDHIDMNGLNNQRQNLRLCTRQENYRNRTSYHGSSSRYKGVGFHKATGKWQAYIRCDRKDIYLGLFIGEEDAARAYDVKALELFGEFARPNFAPFELEEVER